jgi:glycine/D-amino acid oxidase-like deaminating enzyme
MLGVTGALATATLIADLIERGRTDLDLSPFDPGRFVAR